MNRTTSPEPYLEPVFCAEVNESIKFKKALFNALKATTCLDLCAL